VNGPAPSSGTIPAGGKLPLASGRVGPSSPWQRSAYRTQYVAAGRAGAGTPPMPTAPNKANFPWADTSGRGPVRSPRPAPPGRSVRNKANSARATPRTSTLWKESCDELDPQKASAEQSQFPDRQQWARGGRASGAAGGARRAKQSQLARTDRKSRRPAGPQAVEPPRTSVRNKANFRGRAGTPDPQSAAVCRPHLSRKRWNAGVGKKGPPIFSSSLCPGSQWEGENAECSFLRTERRR
jgi:hypothetical protein